MSSTLEVLVDTPDDALTVYVAGGPDDPLLVDVGGGPDDELTVYVAGGPNEVIALDVDPLDVLTVDVSGGPDDPLEVQVDLGQAEVLVDIGNIFQVGGGGLPDGTTYTVDGLGVSMDGVTPMSGGLAFFDIFEFEYAAAEGAHIIIIDIATPATKIWEVHELSPWVEIATPVIGDWIVTSPDAQGAQAAQLARVLASGPLIFPVTENEQSIFNRLATQGGHPLLPFAGAAIIGVDTTEFHDNLSPADDTVQKSLNTLDGLGRLQSYTAGVDLSGHTLVILDTAGELEPCDSTTLVHAGRAIGITTGAITNGEAGPVQVAGDLDEPSWAWDVDLPIFAGPGGALTQTEPTALAGDAFSQVVGFAPSSTSIHLTFNPPIIL